MKLLSVIGATKSNWRLWTLALAGIQLSFATFDSFGLNWQAPFIFGTLTPAKIPSCL